jgi:hypothetical protein
VKGMVGTVRTVNIAPSSRVNKRASQGRRPLQNPCA